MPMVTVEYPNGQLSSEQKSDLAKELTEVLLEIEGGGDTPNGRAGSLVRFRESDRLDWFVGGENDETHVRGRNIFYVEIFVPEGLLDQASKTNAHEATTKALARVTNTPIDQTRYFWIQINEWPEGSLASNGTTVSLFGLAKRANHPADHPVLTFPRAYFEAKGRLYDTNGFPEATAGRVLNPY